MTEKINVAVLGAAGSVGQRYVELLEKHPWFNLSEVVGSPRSAGKTYGEAADWRLSSSAPESVSSMVLKHPEDEVESPIVFCSLPGGIARETELKLAGSGHYVFSNARDNRMDDDVPLMIPEVNSDHSVAIEVQRRNRGFSNGFVVTNPNCSTIHLVLARKPVWDAFGISQCMVTTMQAVSGAGYPGVPSLDMIDNVVPFIGGEEEKMESESRKLLGSFNGSTFEHADLLMSAQCNRVPVRHGHLETVNLKLDRKATPEDVEDVMRSFRGRPQDLGLPSAPARPIVVNDSDDRPQPALDRDVEHGMSSVVGRVRECSIFDIKFVVLGHNTIRGAAGASILNAEMLLADELIQR
jgi:aspartate-semialdehyde dehydrogenase